MRLNKKGITLIEIIISIVLISIVLVFLFNLLVNVKDINEASEVNSTYLVNKSLILKNIDEDLSKVDSEIGINISTCNIKDFYSGYNSGDSYFIKSDEHPNNGSEHASLLRQRSYYECIMLSNDNWEENAYIAIYYYKSKEDYVISYVHDNIRITRLLPNYEIYNKTKSEDKQWEISNRIKLVNSNNNICNLEKISNGYYFDGSCDNDEAGFYKIEIPIIGDDGKDYTILIPYYGKVSVKSGLESE